MLGKEPCGSLVIATRANFSALLSIFSSLKDNAEASNEALRCIANALLLISDGRQTFVQKDVGGGDVIVELLEVRTSSRRVYIPRILMMRRNQHPLIEYSSHLGYYSLQLYLRRNLAISFGVW